jgi:flagellar hook-length control protein FliK
MQVFPAFAADPKAPSGTGASARGDYTAFAATLHAAVEAPASSAQGGFNSAFRSLSAVINGDSVVPDSLDTPFVPEKAAARANDLFSSVPASPDTLKDLRDALADLGVSEETLDKMMTQASASGGISWNQLMQMLQQDITSRTAFPAAEFDAPTRNAFQSLLQKLGFTDKEVGQLTEEVQAGNVFGSWQAITRKLDAAPDSAVFSLDRSELQALGIAMRLPSDALKRLQSAMGNAEGMTITRDGLKQALSEISGTISQVQDSIDNKVDQLRDIIRPAMNKALEDTTKAAQADNRQTKETGNSLIIMRDTTQSKITERLQAEAHPSRGAAEAAAAAEKNRQGLRDIKTAENGTADAASTDAVSGDGLQRTAKAVEGSSLSDNGHEQQHGHEGSRDKESLHFRNAAEQLIRHAEVRSAEPLLPGAQQQRVTPQELQQQAADKARSEKILEQVEKGLIQTMRNGQNRMTLRLDPPELGRIAVTLSVVNKEVTAVIRPESPEAVKAVNDQLHHLRASLERQGLKVERLEVQQQMQDTFSSPSWQGAEQHNETRQKHQWQQREQRLAAIRREGSALAQEMQSPAHKARITTSSVDIIA